MMFRKLKVGKNPAGWYLAIPRFGGAWDVIDHLSSWGHAMELANRMLGYDW